MNLYPQPPHLALPHHSGAGPHHDELVVECLEDQAEEVSRVVEEVMVEIINPGLDDFHPDRVPAEVEVESRRSWAV